MSILKVKPGCLTVSFEHLLQWKPHNVQKEIVNYWHSQGYAEAELIPYVREEGYLEVTRELPDSGFLIGTGTLDQEVYEIPF
ncbi:MAG: hypothetical protein DSM106950_01315 [Stigonema ocellatum SAG 48.90 = DSM 106950]|nr:hypothetical protein [Stigonema ocellatum SAG 48.90 = DSM 106950]